METEDSAAAHLTADGQRLKALASAALAWLEQHYEHVNTLNVFPVPDGDTGTNMLLTMREAYQGIAESDDDSAGSIAAVLAYGALNGARGNSGTILSQLWQGFAQALQGQAALDAAGLAQGCREAARMAYAAVSAPAEGTILTVTREIMEAVVQRVETDGERDLVRLLVTMVRAGRASLRRTPDLLPILKQAGVVDSGGQGLVYLLEGMLHAAAGRDLSAPTRAAESAGAGTPQDWQQALEPEDDEGYGYDVQFRMHGTNLDVDAMRRAMEDIGWSTVVVGSDRLIKVHVHVHDPGKPISYAIAQGVEIDDVVVENMQIQYQTFVQQRAAREGDAAVESRAVAVIAVAPGTGLRRLFQDELGAARVVTGGQTMNPSTGDFLEAINAITFTDEIVILPNNKNIVLAAQQAAGLAQGKHVRVVPSRTIPQGISAMFAYSTLPDCREAGEMAAAMQESLAHVTSAEITTATRSVEIGGVTVQAGQFIGLLEGSLALAGDDMTVIARELLRKAEADKRELITLYYGSDSHRAKAQALVDALAEDFPEQAFEIVYGGQALYPYIISVE